MDFVGDVAGAAAATGGVQVVRRLRYFKGKFPHAAAWQMSAAGMKDYQTADGIRVAPALALLSQLA